MRKGGVLGQVNTGPDAWVTLEHKSAKKITPAPGKGLSPSFPGSAGQGLAGSCPKERLKVTLPGRGQFSAEEAAVSHQPPTLTPPGMGRSQHVPTGVALAPWLTGDVRDHGPGVCVGRPDSNAHSSQGKGQRGLGTGVQASEDPHRAQTSASRHPEQLRWGTSGPRPGPPHRPPQRELLPRSCKVSTLTAAPHHPSAPDQSLEGFLSL